MPRLAWDGSTHREPVIVGYQVPSADLDYTDQETSGPTPVRLSYLGRDILLVPGTYLLGRSAACHMVVDDPLVSRRHARIQTTTDSTTIEDLGSINGVFVNGQRIGSARRSLSDGDRIDIGNAQFVFHVGGFGSERRPSGAHGLTLDTLNGADPVVPADDQVVEQTPESSTREVDGFMMISAIAERFLRDGRVCEAEEMLREHLAAVMDDACEHRTLEAATIESAASAALSLAAASGKGRWFDYCIELLWRSGHECREALHAKLEQSAMSVDEIDAQLVRRYAVFVRGTSPTFDQLRNAQRLETIARSAERKR